MSEFEMSPISYWIVTYNEYFYSNIDSITSLFYQIQ